MKRNRYIPYTVVLFYLTGCSRIREWERQGSPEMLPIEVRKKWYDEQRQRDLQHNRERYQWMEERR